MKQLSPAIRILFALSFLVITFDAIAKPVQIEVTGIEFAEEIIEVKEGEYVIYGERAPTLKQRVDSNIGLINYQKKSNFDQNFENSVDELLRSLTESFSSDNYNLRTRQVVLRAHRTLRKLKKLMLKSDTKRVVRGLDQKVTKFKRKSRKALTKLSKALSNQVHTL